MNAERWMTLDSSFIIHHSSFTILVYDPEQMRNLSHDATRRRRVLPFDGLVELGDTETFDDLFLLFGIADHAPVILDLDLSAAVLF